MRRQVAVAAKPIDWPDVEPRRLGSWWLYAGCESRVQLGDSTCLIGLAADVETAEPVAVEQLDELNASAGPAAVADYCDQLAGRFLVLVATADELRVIPDGWASLQGFWTSRSGGPVVLSTSPALLLALGLGHPERAEQDSLLADPQARDLEYRSHGDVCPVSGASRLLPNHVLELPEGRAVPMAMRYRPADFTLLTEEISAGMRGLRAAHGGPVRVPVTAGLDSRWLSLAVASTGMPVKLFTFQLPGLAVTTDAEVGAIVAQRLGLGYEAVELPAAVSDRVKGEVLAVRGFWRDLDKMLEIEHYAARRDRVLVFNGNGGEILRGSRYGTGPRLPTRRLLRSLCLGRQPAAREIAGFDRWYEQRHPVAASDGLEMYDLFYWEQRIANWGSDFYGEKENFVDELSPFCCRRILLAGPAAGGRDAAVPLAQHLGSEPSLADVPVNPDDDSSRIKRLAVPRQLGTLLMDTAAAARKVLPVDAGR